METRTYFAIASDHEAIGSISLMPGVDVHRFTAELGYWLAEPFQGNGIMTEAIRALSEYAFEQKRPVAEQLDDRDISFLAKISL